MLAGVNNVGLQWWQTQGIVLCGAGITGQVEVAYFHGGDEVKRAASLARIFHQGRARVGCDAVRWQGETTLRAHARKEEQRSQRAAARLNRVCSARTKLDLALEAKKVSLHAVLRGIGERPGEISGLAPILFRYLAPASAGAVDSVSRRDGGR